MKAICVNPDEIDEVWPHVAGLIRQAMLRGGLGSFVEVEKAVLSGKYLLWLAMNGPRLLGAAVTSLEKTEWDKTCLIVACGGKEVANWIGCIEAIEKFARDEGCNSVRLYGREGWIRMLPPQYRTKRVVIERAL